MKDSPKLNTLSELFGETIYSYSRAQAIEDGYLIDVSTMAQEAGIRFPVALTRAVWDEYITPDERSLKYGQSEEGRLWDTLWMFRVAARRTQTDTLHYQLFFIMKKRQRRLITLKAVIGPGDDAYPVITIMKPEED